MREDLARFFSIPKKAENVPKIYLGDIFRFFWRQIKYFPCELKWNQVFSGTEPLSLALSSHTTRRDFGECDLKVEQKLH